MKTNIAAAAALATIMSLGVVNAVDAAAKKQEKCYGIAQAGQNDCSNLAGTHSCAGYSTTDNDMGEWKLVPTGKCAELGGVDKSAAKKLFKEMKDKKKAGN
ncbi:MAG: putative membrane protein [Alphaproteobacteria bacterium]|jgi:uncharacterized membrane protein